MDPQGRHWLVGGGIASLAAAAFLIRDAGVPGPQITVLEGSPRMGGSLDGTVLPGGAGLTRGGRMFEPRFACAFDLLGDVPMPGGGSVLADIMAFNRAVPGSSRCRLIRAGACADMGLGLGLRDKLALGRLIARPEAGLDGRTIGSCFARGFFDTNFWLMWSTMFSFQPWHSAAEMRRYLRRFMHLFPGFARMEGVLRTRFNQYDAVIAPLVAHLESQGVRMDPGAEVTDADIAADDGARRVTALHVAGRAPIAVAAGDRVYFTLGSMTDGATIGADDAPPPNPVEGPAARLWRALARHPGFGAPDAFLKGPARCEWTSFTATLTDPAFFAAMEHFTTNRTGTGGLITFPGSGWLMSIVLFHQPHFRDQAPGTQVFWGYGLRPDRPGDAVPKPMAACSGQEMLTELRAQLPPEAAAALTGATAIPARMPLITSQFMPRRAGDRPKVIPEGAANFAVLGQFCEQPEDTVFTVEYSVRSAMAAVHALTGRGNAPPPVAQPSPGVMLRAVGTMLRG